MRAQNDEMHKLRRCKRNGRDLLCRLRFTARPDVQKLRNQKPSREQILQEMWFDTLA